MGNLWVCYFPSCTTLVPCRECKLSPTHFFLQPSTTISLPLSQFHLRASQTTNTRTRTKTRRSRKLKSDAEICNDIRQFLASVGLPEDHIPSTKELLHHGWNELANIVRRRGHKQIREILTTTSLNADVDYLNAETSLDERLDAANECEDPLTGQNERVDSLVNDVSALTSTSSYVGLTTSLDEGTSVTVEAEDGLGEVKDHAQVVNDGIEGNFYPPEMNVAGDDFNSSREGLYHPNFDSRSSMPTEISGELSFETVSSGNSENEDRVVGNMVGEMTLPSAVLSMENHSITSFNDSDLDTGDSVYSHLEPLVDLSLEQNDLSALEGLDDSHDVIAEDVPTTVSVRENLSGDNRLDSIVHSADSSSMNLVSSVLKEKVANFIQNGDLDPIEDHDSGISSGDDSQESKEYIESEPAVDMPLGTHPPKDNNVMAHHGVSLTSEQVVPSGELDQPLWDDHMPKEDLATDSDNDMDTEAPKVQNESEINHLKFMLYQKELELSRMKEQIEKEKLALSVLQTKAEAEISKARKLISEKDAELNVAEESLSGLKEVQIEFFGDGDVVEVAGSFNGWHHRIKLDLQPSISDLDLGGSRRPGLWSTMLWLYPGVYEIKFVVDGQWRTDPQRESVTRGHICNNILRVDR